MMENMLPLFDELILRARIPIGFFIIIVIFSAGVGLITLIVRPNDDPDRRSFGGIHPSSSLNSRLEAAEVGLQFVEHADGRVTVGDREFSSREDGQAYLDLVLRQQQRDGHTIPRTLRDPVAEAICGLAACVVVADGRVSPEEVVVAGSIGVRGIRNFDADRFVQYCKDPTLLSRIDTMIKEVEMRCGAKEKELIIAYLMGIARIDGYVHEKEDAILENAAEAWNVNLAIMREKFQRQEGTS